MRRYPAARLAFLPGICAHLDGDGYVIERIGFFHFADDYHDPFGSLNAALLEQDNLGNSLIVVPEAFNNGRSYYDAPRGQPKFTFREAVIELTRIAAERGAAFVAGLLAPPFNSAYFVDGSGAVSLCSKKCDDQTGHSNPAPGTVTSLPLRKMASIFAS